MVDAPTWSGHTSVASPTNSGRDEQEHQADPPEGEDLELVLDAGEGGIRLRWPQADAGQQAEGDQPEDEREADPHAPDDLVVTGADDGAEPVGRAWPMRSCRSSPQLTAQVGRRRGRWLGHRLWAGIWVARVLVNERTKGDFGTLVVSLQPSTIHRRRPFGPPSGTSPWLRQSRTGRATSTAIARTAG